MRYLHLLVSITAASFLLLSCNEAGGTDGDEVITFVNPVIKHNCADPSIMDDRARSGFFFLYSTQDGTTGVTGCRYLPIYKSKDMVAWVRNGDAFPDGIPEWCTGARLWAPDINYINGKYVLYYAAGFWDEPHKSSVGVAVADSPEGPFTDLGFLVGISNTGVSNSIDPNYFEDGDKHYLFWGSLGTKSGIWVVELTDDGLHIKDGSVPLQVGYGNMEGTYVHRHGKYYYMFTSMGSCCAGAASTYHIVVGRSDNVLGPYTDASGKAMTASNYNNTILSSMGSIFVGTGHNAEIITDDAGQEWMPYHSYWYGNDYDGRCLMLTRIFWKDDWPYFLNSMPIEEEKVPTIK